MNKYIKFIAVLNLALMCSTIAKADLLINIDFPSEMIAGKEYKVPYEVVSNQTGEAEKKDLSFFVNQAVSVGLNAKFYPSCIQILSGRYSSNIPDCINPIESSFKTGADISKQNLGRPIDLRGNLSLTISKDALPGKYKLATLYSQEELSSPKPVIHNPGVPVYSPIIRVVLSTNSGFNIIDLPPANDVKEINIINQSL